MATGCKCGTKKSPLETMNAFRLCLDCLDCSRIEEVEETEDDRD